MVQDICVHIIDGDGKDYPSFDTDFWGARAAAYTSNDILCTVVVWEVLGGVKRKKYGSD